MANNTFNQSYDLYRVFYHVAKRKSLTRAAGDLGVSQPAVSQSIKQLEDILGVKLTHRCAHGIALTPEGQKLFPLVKKGCEAFDKCAGLFDTHSDSEACDTPQTVLIHDVFISGTQYCHFAGQKLPYRILEHLPLILPQENDPSRTNLCDFLKGMGINIKPTVTAVGNNAILSDVIRNVGIGYVPYDFAKPYINSSEVYLLEFESEIPARTANT